MPTIGRPNPAPITAAAVRKVKLSAHNAGVIKEFKDDDADDRAWTLYDRLGEVHYGINTRAQIAGRIRYLVASKGDPNNEPQPIILDPDDPDDPAPTAAQVAAVALLEDEGGAEMLRDLISELIIHFDVVGKAYVVATSDSASRKWVVMSTQELRKSSSPGKLAIFGDDGKERQQFDKDQVFKVWRPHPRDRSKADAPLKAVLEIGEELVLLGRAGRAKSISRLPAGVWIVPDSIDLADPNDPDQKPFDVELANRLARPISDPGASESLVPWIVTMDVEDIKVLKDGMIRFDREWEEDAAKREELIRRIANGLDLPPEVILGMADLNHWSSWLVTDTAVSQHVAPTVTSILDALTIGWFHPMLEAAQIDPGGIVLWRDLAPAIVPPERTDVTMKAWDRGMISFEAARRELGFDEEDAPSLEDLELIGWLRGKTEPTKEEIPIGGVPNTTPPGQAALVAATRPVETIELSELAAIDRALLAYVVSQTEAAIDRAFEKAGSRLRSATQGDKMMRALIDEVPTHRVPSVIGEGQALALFGDRPLVTVDDFAAVLARIRARVSLAQAASISEVARILHEDFDDDPQIEEDLDAAMGFLGAALLAAILAILFTPSGEPDPEDVGEISDPRVPTEILREALSIAGGGTAQVDGVNAAELVGNGHRVRQLFTERGYVTTGFTWQYGDLFARTVNFEPHVDLDGVTVTDWNDGRLETPIGTWLSTARYYPGDHRGCLCTYTREITITVPLPVAATTDPVTSM